LRSPGTRPGLALLLIAAAWLAGQVASARVERTGVTAALVDDAGDGDDHRGGHATMLAITAEPAPALLPPAWRPYRAFACLAGMPAHRAPFARRTRAPPRLAV